MAPCPARAPLATHRQTKPGHIVTATTFRELPPSTVAHALSRLAARGELVRVRRGHYYVPRTSRFGPVPADRLHVALSALDEVRYTPGGVAAANALGFTTQLPMGRADIISTRGRRLRRRGLEGLRILERSPVRRSLTLDENAFLEVLRDIKHLSDLSAEETRARAVHNSSAMGSSPWIAWPSQPGTSRHGSEPCLAPWLRRSRPRPRLWSDIERWSILAPATPSVRCATSRLPDPGELSDRPAEFNEGDLADLCRVAVVDALGGDNPAPVAMLEKDYWVTRPPRTQPGTAGQTCR